MRFSCTVRAGDLAPTDVLLELDEQASVAQVESALCRTLGVAGGQGLWVGTTRIAADADVAGSPLREGALISLGANAQAAPFAPPTRGWALHAVSGRDAGLVVGLPIGEHVLGRGGVPPFSDPSMSRRHAILRVTETGATLADLGSSNGTTLDGTAVPLDGAEGAPPVEVQPGQLIGVGDTLVSIAAATRPDAAIEPGPAGHIDFTRPPRLAPSGRGVTVVVPTKPVTRQARKIPVAGVLAPILMGGVMAGVTGNLTFLLFTLMTPVMAVSNYVSDRRSSAQTAKRDQAKYEQDLAAADVRLAEGLAQETLGRRVEHPDAAQVLLTATLPSRRLWERRRRDGDAFVLRVGTADQPARLKVTTASPALGNAFGDQDPTAVRTVFGVPATVPLRDIGVLGLAGPEEDLRGLARWLVLQLAVHHGPRDVSLVVLAPRSGGSWTFARWLPQARPVDPDTAAASVGCDPDTTAARITDLASQVKARKEAARNGRADRSTFPAVVVVIEGARALRGLPGLAQVLIDGPEVGVMAICLEAEERLLPEECSATLVLEPEDPAHLTVRRTGFDPLPGVLTELVSEAVATAAARAIAPVRDVSHDEEDSSLPDSARLLDVLGLEPPTVDAIRARWQLEGRTTRIQMGYGAEGVYSLDLRSDGPHGLIAGTTGSGKSELLQTIIASLAVANRPDAMNFVLVDYKGGSAFKDCVALPHTVGMVTDLDNHLVERALTSLGAELKRREHQLADAAVKDIEDYLDASLRQPLPPLPRLLIVIDEFASLARELPDFVTGLVNIAQRGRSLGIHLLLATQRPSGVVSPEIRANTNLRISLRVTDAGDSTDVLDSPEAARIPKSAPGRGYARLGAGALQPFQAGRVGGRRPGLRPTHAPEPFVAELGWGQLGYPPPSPPRQVVADDAELTDLSVLVEAVTDAAVAERLAGQRTPWLPALPHAMAMDELPPAAPAVGDLPPLVYGIEDLPALQVQRAAAIDLTRDGHLLAIGSPRSGRSQLLRTLAAAAASLSVADLHIYGVDCGNGALLPLTELPHCGAVVSRTQTERAVRLMARLTAELERRQNLLAERGFADITEQRRTAEAGDRLPHLLLLIDRWEGWTTTLGELDSGKLTDQVMTMMREGASVGLHLVITGDRSLSSGRISSLTENKLAFRLADRADYSNLGLNPRKLPDEIPPGRTYANDTGVEAQVALVTSDPSGQAQGAALAAIGVAAAARDAHLPAAVRPFRVDMLPSRIDFDAALAMRATTTPAWALVGVGGDELAAVGVDFDNTSSFIVAGPTKSGRSTVLTAMARSLTRSGTPVIIGAPRPSPLRDLAGREGVLDVITDVNAGMAIWDAAMEKAGGERVIIILDDADVLRDSPAGELFRAVIKGAGDAGEALVLGGNAEGICAGLSGWQVEAKKARCGVLLSPQSTGDGDLIGMRLPRSTVGGAIQPGRGLLHAGDGRLVTIATPTL